MDVTPQDTPLLDVRQLSKSFQVGRDRVQALRRRGFHAQGGADSGPGGRIGERKVAPLARILAGSSAASGGQFSWRAGRKRRETP